MSNTMNPMILLCVFVGGLLLPGMQKVSGMHVYTEVEALNGTDVKLRCIFSSRYPVTFVSVIWKFKPLHGRPETVMYYKVRPYPPPEGRFRNQVVWSGDVMKKDASITLLQVSQTFSGTYTCTVRNPPDVHGRDGEVVLRVANKTTSFIPHDLHLDIIWK
ncbi:hypothetical protein OYC64_020411 [Pagothenia borchgrevinki]